MILSVSPSPPLPPIWQQVPTRELRGLIKPIRTRLSRFPDFDQYITRLLKSGQEGDKRKALVYLREYR